MAIPSHPDPAAADRARRRRELAWCLRLLRAGRGVFDGLPVDGLTHALQCATRASQEGVDEPLILAALLHDVARPLGCVNHPAIAAEMLKERVSDDLYWVLRTHGEFQAVLNGGDPLGCEEYREEPWFDDAAALANWDHASFDPGYPTPGLGHFVPGLRRLYGVDG